MSGIIPESIENINQINPKYWGNSLWKCLNCFALTYQIENRQTYKIFFEKIGDLLPCGKCREHYKTYLPKLDDALNNKSNLLAWLLEIRNNINAGCGKKPLSLNDVLVEIYGEQNPYCNGFNNDVEAGNSNNSNNSNKSDSTFFSSINWSLVMLIFILIILILLFVYSKTNNKSYDVPTSDFSYEIS